MPTQINLLPWREELLRAKRQRFAVLIATCLCCAVIMQLCLGHYLESRSRAQKQRIGLLNDRLTEVDKQVNQHQQLELQQQTLSAKLQQLRALQWQRVKPVQVMTLLATLTPQEVYLDSIDVQAQQVVVSGVGRTADEVAQLLEKFEQSHLVSNLVMHSIQHNQLRFGSQYQVFRLSFTLPFAPKESEYEQ